MLLTFTILLWSIMTKLQEAFEIFYIFFSFINGIPCIHTFAGTPLHASKMRTSKIFMRQRKENGGCCYRPEADTHN